MLVIWLGFNLVWKMKLNNLHFDTYLSDIDLHSWAQRCEKPETAAPILTKVTITLSRICCAVEDFLFEEPHILCPIQSIFNNQYSRRELSFGNFKQTKKKKELKDWLRFTYSWTDFFYKLSSMTGITKLYSGTLILFWITLTFIEGHSWNTQQKFWWSFCKLLDQSVCNLVCSHNFSIC